jgi:FkbM family methyltransferase
MSWKNSTLKILDVIPFSWRLRLHGLPVVGLLLRVIFKKLTKDSKEEVYVISAGPAKGLRFSLRLPEEKAFWKGTHEHLVVKKLYSECRPGDACWDVGGHIGFVAAVMAKASGKPVTSFEPFKENAERIRLAGRLNPGLTLNVIEVAITDTVGTIKFSVHADSSMGKCATSGFQSDASAERTIDILATTGDRLVDKGEAPPPSLIKIDTEGGEYRVLKGAAEVLRRYRPRLLLEIHGCPEDLLIASFLLDELKYDAVGIENPLQKGREAFLSPGHVWCEPL